MEDKFLIQHTKTKNIHIDKTNILFRKQKREGSPLRLLSIVVPVNIHINCYTSVAIVIFCFHVK